MKVYPCSQEFPEKKEPKTLTWEEIKREEGVYARSGKDDYDYKLVVLKFGSTTSVLFSYGDRLEPTSEIGWSDMIFIRLENAKVCFEIREE